MQHKHHESKDSYHLHRTKPGGLISVLNQDGYLMAQYNQNTGITAWQRVVPVSKRDSVEQRLIEQYPVVVETQEKKPPRRKP